jgi:DNA polymerase/3'-5' exonuclease PolX
VKDGVAKILDRLDRAVEVEGENVRLKEQLEQAAGKLAQAEEDLKKLKDAAPARYLKKAGL